MMWFIRAYICQWTDESQFVSLAFKEVSKLPLEKHIQIWIDIPLKRFVRNSVPKLDEVVFSS